MSTQQEQNHFYKTHIEPFLPPKILDFHAHLWLEDQWKDDGAQAGPSEHARYVTSDHHYPVERLLADGEASFPGRYEAVVFGHPTPAVHIDRTNDYIAASARPGLYPLMVTGAAVCRNMEEMEETFVKGGFLGYKVYLNWVGDDYGSVKTAEMLLPEQLAFANKRRLVVLLHVPGSRRLADPEVQEDVMAWARKYPDIRFVLAHCGRCYVYEEIMAASSFAASLPENVCLDISMAHDPFVIAVLLQRVGPKRLLFATDFPIAAMKGRRVTLMDHWVDVTLPGETDARFRVQSGEIRAMTMAREQARALIAAAFLCGIGKDGLADMFWGNGMRLLKKTDQGEESCLAPPAK